MSTFDSESLQCSRPVQYPRPSWLHLSVGGGFDPSFDDAGGLGLGYGEGPARGDLFVGTRTASGHGAVSLGPQCRLVDADTGFYRPCPPEIPSFCEGRKAFTVGDLGEASRGGRSGRSWSSALRTGSSSGDPGTGCTGSFRRDERLMVIVDQLGHTPVCVFVYTCVYLCARVYGEGTRGPRQRVETGSCQIVRFPAGVEVEWVSSTEWVSLPEEGSGPEDPHGLGVPVPPADRLDRGRRSGSRGGGRSGPVPTQSFLCPGGTTGVVLGLW